jgi:predicted peroxiredoxin
MSDSKKLVITLTVSPKDDNATVAFTVANAALGKGMDVGVFLASDGVENSRGGATDFTHVTPFKKLSELVETFGENGGVIWSCAPCFNHRGLDPNAVVRGTVVTGAGPMLDWIQQGAATLNF